MKSFSVIISCVAIIMILATQYAYSQGNLYRYKNEQGVTVISSTIPPRFVSKGYDIITPNGQLIKTVPREPSPEEKARLVKQQAEEKRLKAWDNELLRRYSRAADIEEAKQRRLEQNASAIRIIQRSIEKIDRSIVYYQGLAAGDEREGREVNDQTLEKIAQLKQDRLDAEKEIKTLEKENQSIVEKFDKDIERFNTIRP